MLQQFQDYNLLLASQSPRRQQLLTDLGVPFTVRTKPGIEENYPDTLPASDVAVFLSELKAKAFASELSEPNTILITADTVVVLGDEVLGKPTDKADALATLQKLSGKEHEVITGVSLTSAEKQVSFSCSTSVFFKELSQAEIEYYVDNYKPFDKAGAYGIQEWIGYIGVERIDGSYFNVMGLPIQRLYQELLAFVGTSF